jgi:dihydrofolate reductase
MEEKMRKIVLSMMLSLDGKTARPDGNLDWFLTDREFEDEMLSLLRSVDGMLFGRRSYELLADYWPTADQPGAPEAPGGFTSKERGRELARLMNTLPKLVVSTTLKQLPWGPARLIASDLAGEIRRLKAESGKDLVLFAGAGLARTFMQLDLLDEWRLMLHPIALGAGLELFAPPLPERALRLLEARAFSSGVVLLRYARSRL